MTVEDVLVCASVLTATAILPGSIRSVCARCGAAVWVAPSGQVQLATGRFIIYCGPCFESEVGKGPAVITISPQSLAEIRSWYSRN